MLIEVGKIEQKKTPFKEGVFSRIEAKNHTPHSVFQEGMFFGLHNSAHRSVIIASAKIENK